MDTASLLIGMYRSCGIPARYVVGTVNVTLEQVEGWLGGFTSTAAAVSALQYGGVPLAEIVQGGERKSVVMEHAWVEAWLSHDRYMGAGEQSGDMAFDMSDPRRGGREWMRMDPSYKQYEWVDAPDIASELPEDLQAMAEGMLDGVTVDETTGEVSGLDYGLMQQNSEQLQAMAEEYVDAHPEIETVQDIVGGRKIIEKNLDVFPNQIETWIAGEVEIFSEPLENYRWHFGLEIESDINASPMSGIDAETLELLGYDSQPSYILEEEYMSTVRLASKRITLSFGPATADDEAYVTELAQQDPPPSSVNANVLRVKPQLLVDGVLVKEGSEVKPGAVLKSHSMVYPPNYSLYTATTFDFPKDIDAGAYYGVGLRLGVPAKQFLEKKQAIFEDAGVRLDESSEVYKDEVVGEVLHSAITTYFSAVTSLGKQIALGQKIFYFPLPCVSFVHAKLETSRSLYMPGSSVKVSGFVTDVHDRIMNLSLDGDMNKSIIFAGSYGPITSYWEGEIYHLLFNDVAINPVSTVHVQAAAASEGQKMFTITKDNVNETLAEVVGLPSNTETDIRMAVFMGKEVSIHEKSVERGDWKGFGYTIIDPITGAGVYMIDGGIMGGGSGNKCKNTQSYRPPNYESSNRYAGAVEVCAGVSESICAYNKTLCALINLPTDNIAQFIVKGSLLFLSLILWILGLCTFLKTVSDKCDDEQKIAVAAFYLVFVLVLLVILALAIHSGIAFLAVIGPLITAWAAIDWLFTLSINLFGCGSGFGLN